VLSSRYFCLILTKFLDFFTLFFKFLNSKFHGNPLRWSRTELHTCIPNPCRPARWRRVVRQRVLYSWRKSSRKQHVQRLPWWAPWPFWFRWWKEQHSGDSTTGNWILVVQPVATHITDRATSVISINRTPDIPYLVWATFAHADEIKRLAKPTS